MCHCLNKRDLNNCTFQCTAKLPLPPPAPHPVRHTSWDWQSFPNLVDHSPAPGIQKETPSPHSSWVTTYAPFWFPYNTKLRHFVRSWIKISGSLQLKSTVNLSQPEDWPTLWAGIQHSLCGPAPLCQPRSGMLTSQQGEVFFLFALPPTLRDKNASRNFLPPGLKG